MKTTLFFLLATFLCLNAVKAQTQTQFSIAATSTVSCNDDASLTVNFTNGTAPYQLTLYTTQTGTVYDQSVSSNSIVINNLANGEYYISASDANGYYSTLQQYRISSPISANFTIVNATCLASNNGSIAGNPSGGIAPYSYLWSNGATTNSLPNTNSGQYFVSITDQQGCIFHSDSLYVAFIPSFNVDITNTNISCQVAGTATATVAGGGTYSYFWNTTPIQTTQTATGLVEGHYRVVVTDQNNCSADASTYLFEINAFNISLTQTKETCLLANGSITASPSGGTAPYTYLWDTGAKTASITNLSAYIIHTVTATDALGCISKESEYIYRTSPIQTSTSSTDALCNNGGGGSAYVFANNGTAPYSYSWNTGQTTASITNISKGFHYVNITDGIGCSANTYAYVNELPTCTSTITGSVYNDINGNCIKENGEDGLQWTSIEYAPNQFTYTNQNGDYSIRVASGIYQLQVTPPSGWTQTCLPISLTVNASVGGTTYANNDFLLNPGTPRADVRINVYAGGFRPGLTGNNVIYYTNDGTRTESGTIEYTFSNDWEYFDASPTPTTYDPILRKATWTYSALKPFETRYIYVSMSVASTTSLGTALQASVTITTILTDIDLTNNSSTLNTFVVGSFDPNDIQVSPQGSGTEGYIVEEEVLTYRIRFQNTGTAEAYNVSVSNEIDANLEDYTLSILDASHAFEANIKDNTITFDFPNINLPDSNSNEPESHGYILYRINRKSDLMVESKIYNQANIYFDYNAPVETNRVQNTIGTTTATTSTETVEQNVLLFPNPCQDKLNLLVNNNNESVLSVILYTASGKAMNLLEETSIGNGKQQLEIDLSALQLPNGIYIIKSILNDRVNTQQLIINK